MIGDDFELLSKEFLSRGGSQISDDYDRFDFEFRRILAWPPEQIRDRSLMARCVAHGAAYAYWQWDARVAALHEPCSQAIEAWASQPDLALDVLCDLFDLAFFLVWCFEGSNINQTRMIMPDMRRLAGRTGVSQRGRLDCQDGRLNVAYLTRSADTRSAISWCMKHVLVALSSQPNRYRLYVYCLEHVDAGTIEWIKPADAQIVLLRGRTPSETIANVRAKASLDKISIMLAADNTAVPTVLFSQRCAPVQGFLQIGLPAWGTLNLDLVYNGFGLDPSIAGWGDAAICPFTPPWDLDELAGTPPPEEVVALRSSFPTSSQIIGCYVRLVKITDHYMKAIEEILLDHKDVIFIVGGTGDASLIKRLLEKSPVRDRIILRPGFVPGQTWARILDVFIDTWPFQGGGSIREVTVAGVPVVSIHSPEMPAMDLEKDPELIAADWDEVVRLVGLLLSDDGFYRRARKRALALAERFSDRSAFEARFLGDLERAIERAQASP